jgi:TRAP-type C4-dicarboxylate transport system permease small subunit
MIDRLNRLLGERLCYLYLAAVVITAYEVVMRYLLNAPTSWAFELTILLCAICYLVSGGYVTAQRKHIAITALYDLMPARVRWWLDLVAMLTGISPSPAIIKPLIAIGALLIVLQLLAQLWRHLTGRASPQSANEP